MKSVEEAFEKIKEKMETANWQGTYAPRHLYVPEEQFLELLDKLLEEGFFVLAVANGDTGARELHWMIVEDSFFRQDFSDSKK